MRKKINQNKSNLSIVEKAVQDLPDEDDRHEGQVDAAQDEDPVLEGVCQLLALRDPLVLVSI